VTSARRFWTTAAAVEGVFGQMKPTLTVEQRARALWILENVRESIAKEVGGDPLLEFALRRYVYVRLSYDERGNPVQRRKLKVKLFDRQQGRCPLCGEAS
jgi:hypothetical protein